MAAMKIRRCCCGCSSLSLVLVQFLYRRGLVPRQGFEASKGGYVGSLFLQRAKDMMSPFKNCRAQGWLQEWLRCWGGED